MRPGSDQLIKMLTGPVSPRLIVDSFYGPTRTKTDLGADGWELTWDSEAEIKSAGTLTVVYNDDLAKSLSPAEFNDVLAPFGQEVNLRLEITVGESFVETVQLGHYRITAVPDARDEHFDHLGQTVTLGSRITLTLEDRLVGLKRWGFRTEQSPVETTCWAELRRISGMQIIASVTDQPVPAGLIYKATRGGRLTAVQDLARVLGGIPYVTPDGALSVLSDTWGAAVAALVLGEEGTILDVGHSMESEGVCNEVVGNFESEDRTPIYAVAELTEGPLATTGQYGRNTLYVTDETITTQRDAQAYVDATLARVSSRQVYRVPVQCLINPLVEDGDLVTVERPEGETLTGRIVNHKFGSGRMMSLELDVQRDV